MNSKNFIAILRNILRKAFRFKLRKILRTLVNEAPEVKNGKKLIVNSIVLLSILPFNCVNLTACIFILKLNQRFFDEFTN